MATKRKSAGKSSTKATASRSTARRSTSSRRKAAPRKAATAPREPMLTPRQARDAAGLVLIALACYLGGLFFLDWDGGALGSNIEYVALLLIGRTAFILPFLMALVGSLMLLRSELVDPGPFRAGLYLLAPTLLLVFAAGRFGVGEGIDPMRFGAVDVVDTGGYLGAVLYYATYTLFGEAGTTIVCVLGVVLSGLFLTGSSVQAITRWWGSRIGHAAVAAGTTSKQVAVRIGEATAEPIAVAREQIAQRSELDDDQPFDGTDAFPDIFGDVPARFAHATRGGVAEADEESIELAVKAKRSSRGSSGDPAHRDAAPEAGEQEQLALLEPVTTGRDEPAEAVAADVLRDRTRDRYTLPSPDLLKEGSGNVEQKPAEVEKIKRLLVETFGHFGIESKIVGMVPGPRVSRYELSLAPGTKMSKVENLRKDLSYALATTEIRILAPIPGKSAVGIEIENAKPGVVTLGDIWSNPPKGASPLHVWFGKDISGEVIGADLAKMPHLLVAGTTGAGKSGCMNAMLSSIVLGASPDEVRMLLIDPKKVELSTYESIPHLLTPVVTNMKKAANALGNIVSQMEERYASMELAGARTLPEYNKIRVARGDAPEPYVLVVIDELADLVMQAKSDVEDAVIRVAQKGRAAGFHLVLATQRPSVDVITGMIKSNVPSRIAFAVSSQTDSRVILDQNGAETLLGSGDMLFKPVWARTMQRVQGAWISESEVRAICEAARAQREPDYDVDLLAEPETGGLPADDPGAVDQDDRLAEAVRLVAEFQTCSASFFQRRMRVGYTRGARLVDMLERRGYVAPGEGPRPRNVLITMDDLPRILAELGEELDPLASSSTSG